MASHDLVGSTCLTLRVRAGAVLECTRGLVWLTFEPDVRPDTSADYIVTPGCPYVAPAHGRIFVSAVLAKAQASFELHPPRTPCAWRDLLGVLGP